MKHLPPQLAKTLLHRFCHVSFLEEIEGDLEEEFYERVQARGLFQAKVRYWIDVMKAIASHRRTSSSRAPFADSLHHFFKIFFRGLRHNRSSSLINIIGLALSLASFIVLSLFVVDELTFDHFHPKADNVYRISYSYKRHSDGAQKADARAGGMWVLELKDRVPEIEAVTRFSRFGWPGSVKYEKGDKIFEEQQVFWADSTYTDIFSLPMVAGNASLILKGAGNVIVNETIAAKYFGDSDPVGQQLIWSWGGMNIDLVVAGVMKNYPSNAHFHPDFIANNIALNPLWKRDGEDRVNNWYDTFTYSFFRLSDGADPGKATTELANIASEHLRKDYFNGDPFILKLTDLHFTQGMVIELETAGDKSYAYIAGSVGILILFIAAANYMNLATARSMRRSKEVGLRKTVGMRRSSLIAMFMGESFMLIVISFIASIAIALLLLPFFNQVTGKTFDLSSLLDSNILLMLSGVVVLLAALAGSYPAFYLSSFKPSEVLKGKTLHGTGAENFRRILVVFQFAVTFMLVVCTVIINDQVSFIRSGKLAEKGQVMTVRLPNYSDKGKVAFRDLVAQNTMVGEVSMSDHLPMQQNFGFNTLPFVVPSVNDDNRMWDRLTGDERFAEMFNLEFIAGRNFSPENAADTSNLILNEAAIRDLNLTPEEALGREVRLNMAQFPLRGIVIGVTKDFSYRSVSEKITPAIINYHYLDTQVLNIKLNTDEFPEAIAGIERSWKKVYPEGPFKYWFMDQEFDRLYRQEMQMKNLSGYFTMFAIVIACLGLFGLASFTAEQKTKEIGIRKVLGASVQQIVLLLSSRFIRLVLISYVIAIPVAFLAMNLWLENFAYKVPIHWWVFAGAGGLILILTYITVGIESMRAALSNPVDSIRHE